MGMSIAAIIIVSILVALGIYSLLDSRARADRARRNAQADVLAEAIETYVETEQSSGLSETAAAFETETQQTVDEQLVPLVDPEFILDESSETIEQQTEPVEVQETVSETTADPNAVEVYFASVYASSDINLRSGPGTGYDVVRVIHVGEGIDVTGRTASGWYRTYSGNYVLIELTTTEPVATTASPTSPTSATAAPQSTTQSMPTTPPNNEPNTAGSVSTDGMTYYGTCHITFYGPQLRSDGTYSTGTATGTTCSEGRTAAADWSIFPAGTVLYLPNDPLGGDGYYTVEDRGPGVNGSHLDLYAEGSHVVTDCEVYIVN